MKILFTNVEVTQAELAEILEFALESRRHVTHATLLGDSGRSLKTAQALLGHSDVETTLNIYTHAIPESQRVAVERVAEILDPNGPKIGKASAA